MVDGRHEYTIKISTLHSQRIDRRHYANIKKNSLNSGRRRQIIYHSEGDSRKTPAGNRPSASGPEKHLSRIRVKS